MNGRYGAPTWSHDIRLRETQNPDRKPPTTSIAKSTRGIHEITLVDRLAMAPNPPMTAESSSHPVASGSGFQGQPNEP